MEAYGYLRVSTKGQIDKDGFKRQRDSIIKFASSSKITIPQFYKEKGISGTKGETDRPAFQEMITEILSNGVNTVIVERLDRLAREYVIQEQLFTFRHTCATDMLRNGAPIRHIQDLLGDESLESTQIYTRVTIDDLKEVHAKYHPGENL